jgi:methylenetetrahydrofolate dehydrogenase (NADP+) / methenyltetrahydrofolate cyclohydrolase
MSERIYGSKILQVIKQRCQPHQQFFTDKSVTIILFKPSQDLIDEQILGQYSAAVTSTNQKVKTFEFLGCKVNRHELTADIKIRQFRDIIITAGKDPRSVGIIVQNPIPDQDLAIGLKEIPPRLDIDGINQTSIFKASATSEAISRLVLGFSQSGDCVAVVGSMGFVGKGVVKLLKGQGIELIELDRRKGDTDSQIEQEILGADLVVSATGKANLIQSAYLKPEHKLVIDAGFILQKDGTVTGDISKKAYDIPQYLTPVPGGVGPTQMAVLLERIFQVAQIELQPWNYQLDIVKPLQQERVEEIAPIMMDYLKLNKKLRVENDSSIVEFDSRTKTVTYQNKIKKIEYLKAQYAGGKWINRGSNISKDKKIDILNRIAPQIQQELSKKLSRQNIDIGKIRE